MKKLPFFLIILCTFTNAFGQLFLKQGTSQLVFDITVLTNYALITGLFLYGISAMLLVLALKFGELTVLYPMISLTFIWVTLLSIFVLQEPVHPKQFAGIGSVLFGVFLIGRGGSS